MTKSGTSIHDQGEPLRSSGSNPKAKMVLIKKENKKPTKKARQSKMPQATTIPISDPLLLNSSSTTGNIDSRIADRAYELYQHRGGHHGQDLEDWLNAEREVLSEGCSC